MSFRYPFRTFFHKKDFYCSKHNLEILKEARRRNIHQIHEQFIIRRGIILPIHLGIAVKTTFCLKAKVPFGEFFLVLDGDLGAFGAGAYDGHVAFQDVQELGELVDTDSTDEAADRGDSWIVLACGESGNAVFLCIHTHATEFVDRKYLPVFGEAVLLVEGGAAVSFDKKTDDEHGDGEDDEGCEGENDVDGTLEEEVLRRWRITTDAEDGQVEEVDLLGAAHDDVTDARQDEGVDAAGNAVFHDDISLMAVDATEEDGLGVLKCFVQVAKAFSGGEGADDFEMDVHAVALDERVHLTPFAQNNDGLFRREISEIPVVRESAPANDEGKLDEESETKRNGIDEVTVEEDSDDVHHGIGKEDCQCLAVNKV